MAFGLRHSKAKCKAPTPHHYSRLRKQCEGKLTLIVSLVPVEMVSDKSQLCKVVSLPLSTHALLPPLTQIIPSKKISLDASFMI